MPAPSATCMTASMASPATGWSGPSRSRRAAGYSSRRPVMLSCRRGRPVRGDAMHARLSLGLAVLGLLIAGLGTAFAAGSGGTRADFYLSHESDPSLLRLSVRLDRVIYALSLAGGKYRAFPVMIENPAGSSRVALSPDEDVFTIIANGHQVRGILDLAHADPA